MKRRFEFLTYRLNIVEQEGLLGAAFPKRLGDKDLAAVFEKACSPSLDHTRSTKTATYKWAIRDCETASYEDTGPVVAIDLARSTVQKLGRIVTDDGVVEGDSLATPPLAVVVRVFVFVRRHLVAAEYNSEIMASQAWLKALTGIAANAANQLDYNSWFELEPVPTESEVMKAFEAFDRLTRLRIHLRLPNPDLTRFTQRLFDQLRNGGIQEYLQDMKSPSGLNRDEEQLPFASASMAQAGYKRGDVQMEGVIDGKYEKLATGTQAARGTIDRIKDYVRGLRVGRRSKEANAVLAAISEELDRIAPPGRDSEEDS